MYQKVQNDIPCIENIGSEYLDESEISTGNFQKISKIIQLPQRNKYKRVHLGQLGIWDQELTISRGEFSDSIGN